MKQITSRDNPTFKSLHNLVENAREQRQRQQTLIDGLHLIEVYRQRGGQPQLLLLAESALDHPQVSALSSGFVGVEILCLRDNLFRELSGVATPTGIAAVIAIPEPDQTLPQDTCVLLDAVQDAGNVGSILRTAAAAGVRDVLLGSGCAGAWTPRVLRAAQGAHFSLNIREQLDLSTLLGQMSMPGVAAVVDGAVPLYQLDLRQPVAWLFGNEGAGLSAALQAGAKLRATIPLAAETESLNVAAAAAVCLFEGLRQRSGMQ
ncbi:MAG TPA: RNA methyltransferase [Rhodocyclaceae bacterium]|nr:RNA methyltransferase [Rhodocyclaceae bacterium]